ncbi:hypothetical protein C2G38_2127244 [Gigaspora rosea]|uniref:Uncharacterized protein n=1 Tax=Gigaspora rosea TaxID=44941 RepID=A0A397TXK6_9GLOM|nr:hypothetical protein C2G38_2127244 [Gigaspora rosea]
MYSILLLWGFLLVFFAPVPFYLLYRRFPNARFDLVNIPLICTELSILPGILENYTNLLSMDLLLVFLSQYHAYRFRTRYNYALSEAFDSAAQIATMTIFFCLNGVVKSSQGKRCFNDE